MVRSKKAAELLVVPRVPKTPLRLDSRSF